MAKHTLIEQAVDHYRDINRLGMEIERSVLERNFTALPGLWIRLEQMQAEAKNDDSAVLAELARRTQPIEFTDFEELLGLMSGIDARNRHLIPRLQNIMEVQRDELRTLCKSARVLQGYNTAPPQTGRRIASMG